MDIFTSPLTMFVQKEQEFNGVVMELLVDDLEEAKKVLQENNC